MGRPRFSSKSPEVIAFIQAAGKRYRYQRVKAGFTQCKLAEKIGSNSTTVSNFELLKQDYDLSPSSGGTFGWKGSEMI